MIIRASHTNEVYRQAAQSLVQSSSTIAVTGAGASVDSGIPDFRSAGGIWSRFPADEYATIEAFWDDPDKVWEMWYELGETLAKAKPNAGHVALAELEAMGRLKAVITQNIDNLHEAAGSASVIEYHGNGHWIVCPSCARRRAFSLDQRVVGAPRCECGGWMKPDVVLFGETIPPQASMRAENLARHCEAMIIVGTSATVYPAAELPLIAKAHGAFVIECNVERTDFTRGITDVFLQGPAAETLPRMVEEVKAIGRASEIA